MTTNLTNTKQQIENLTFCVFDMETTGGNHAYDKIIEIGMVRIENQIISEKKHFLVNPEIKIPEFIQKLTSISEENVKDCPTINKIIDEILEFMGDAILVCHNISFDIPFFNSVLVRLKKDKLENPSLCTVLMTKHLIPNLLNSNLNYMSKIFDIPHKQAHRALDDAMATANLLLKYIDILIQKNIKKLNHIYYPRNRYELDLITIKKDEQVADIEGQLSKIKSPYFITIKGENGVILFALPCINSKSEIKFILENTKKIPWQTISIKLFGSLLEGIAKFNPNFLKISPEIRNDIIKFLWTEHLKNFKKNSNKQENYTTDEHTKKVSHNDVGDFVIIDHIVPEQFIIFPVKTISHRSSLIFRFPAHRKKLLQFIKSRAQKISNNKLRPLPYPSALKNFLLNYLLHMKNTSNKIVVFNSKLPIKNEAEFCSKMEKFISNQKVSYNYPKEYV